jgi:polyphosphate glucokinase
VNVLVIDTGGSHVKLAATGRREIRRFDSGKDLTAGTFVERVKHATADWEYDVVTLGYPGVVGPKGPTADPGNLGTGWVDFPFEDAFRRPVRVVNDAVLQAVGGYEGGRMLFLGLGTGLGSALVFDRVVVPLELGRLALGAGEPTLADRLGKDGYQTDGAGRWSANVFSAAAMLKGVFSADYVRIGGGNANNIGSLPPGVRRGGNEDAFVGGFRLWTDDVKPSPARTSEWWILQ